jgi:thiosulfate dehydrogenase [quinone] large subunit
MFLILGVLAKQASLLGAILLLLFYLSHPAFPGFNQGPTEGSYWIVNKNLIEMAALLVLYCFPTSKYFGLSIFFGKKETPQTV